MSINQEFDDPYDLIDFIAAYCGYAPHLNVCTKAGTEFCDWDCPMRDILEEEQEVATDAKDV